MAQIVMEQAIIVSAFESNKTAGRVYLDILDGEGQWNVTVNNSSAENFKGVLRRPVKIVAETVGRVFQQSTGRTQLVEFKQHKIT